MCARIRWHERCVPQHLREIPAGGGWLCPEHTPAAAVAAAPAACVPVEVAPVPTLASEGLTGSEIKSKLEALGYTVHVADLTAPANRKKLADRLDAVPSCRACSNPLPLPGKPGRWNTQCDGEAGDGDECDAGYHDGCLSVAEKQGADHESMYWFCPLSHANDAFNSVSDK